MADTIVNVSEPVTWDDVMKYGNPKSSKQSAKNIPVQNIRGNVDLRLKTPPMFTWGASCFQGDGGGVDKYSLPIQFNAADYSTAQQTVFLENMLALDTKIFNDIFEHSRDWVNKTYKSTDVLEEIYSASLKYPKDQDTQEPDKSKPPSMRVKLPQWDGVWKFDVFDEDGTPLYIAGKTEDASPLDFLVKGVNVSCILQSTGIWFAGGKFSVTWKLSQVLIKRPTNLTPGQCLLTGTSTPAATSSSTNIATDVEETAAETSVTDVQDTDDESTPMPEAKKQKTTRKKKE